jgi:hypothetical protein
MELQIILIKQATLIRRSIVQSLPLHLMFLGSSNISFFQAIVSKIELQLFIKQATLIRRPIVQSFPLHLMFLGSSNISFFQAIVSKMELQLFMNKLPFEEDNCT